MSAKLESHEDINAYKSVIDQLFYWLPDASASLQVIYRSLNLITHLDKTQGKPRLRLMSFVIDCDTEHPLAVKIVVGVGHQGY